MFFRKATRIIDRLAWLFSGPLINKTVLLLTAKRRLDVSRVEGSFVGKSGIRIGGGLRDEFRGLIEKAERIIDLNAVRDHHSQTTKVDIVGDAIDMSPFASDKFDFVCSSHLLEHLSDPLRALEEWASVLRPGGAIYCGIPNRFTIFDHRRKATSKEHLLADYLRNVAAEDYSHLEEFLTKWDRRLDTVWKSQTELAREVSKRGSNAIHHHVWHRRNVIQLFELAGLRTVYVATKGRTIHAVAQVPPGWKAVPTSS